MSRSGRHAPRVREQKCSCAICALGVARTQTCFSEQRSLLIDDQPGERDLASEGRRDPDHLVVGDETGQLFVREAEERQQLVHPT